MRCCPTCGHSPCTNPSFCKTCRAADRRPRERANQIVIPIRVVADDGVASAADMQAHYDAVLRRRREMFGAPPKSTVESVMYSLREYGAAALAGRNFQNRLAELSPSQVREIIVRLDHLRPKYPAITDSLLLLLAELQQ